MYIDFLYSLRYIKYVLFGGKKLKIIYDATGGDNPTEIIKGAIEAKKEFGIDIFIIGNEDKIINTLRELNYSEDIEIINVSEVIENTDEPAFAIRKKKDSSIVKAMNMLKDEKADGFISAGSTGALLAGGIFIVGRSEGVKRASLPTSIPGYKTSTLIIDSGANMDVDSDLILQFAKMGEVYLEEFYNIKSPKVGLLNVGAEKGKGNDLTKESYELLEKSELNFIGNVEARDIPSTEADLLVCDGFAGNILLKSIEGTSEFILKSIFTNLGKSDISSDSKKEMSIVLKEFFKKLDYSEVGGTMLLGLKKPVIKAHGSSNSVAILNATRHCIEIINKDIIKKIENNLGGNNL